MADVPIDRGARLIGLARPHAVARRLLDWAAIGATGAFIVFLLQFVGG